MLASGKTPAGTHRPIMVAEVLRVPAPSARRRRGGLHARRRRPCAGDSRAHSAGRTTDRTRRRSVRVAADRSAPARGRLRPRDVHDPPRQLRRTAAGPRRARDCTAADIDSRGPRRVVDAARQSRSRLQLQGARAARHADESVARRAGVATARAPERGEARARCSTRTPTNRTPMLIAGLLKQPIRRRRRMRSIDWCARGSRAAHPDLGKADVKLSVRRTLQALRIAVNDEFSALDALLRRAAALPRAGRPGRDPDVSFRRRSAREEGVPGGLARGDLLRDRGRRHSLDDGRNAREPPRPGGEAALGRPGRPAP